MTVRAVSPTRAGMAALAMVSTLAMAGCATMDDAAPAGPVSQVSTFDLRSADPDRVADALRDDGRVVLRGITFATGSARLQPGSQPAVERIADMMNANPDLRLAVVGHTDNVGGFEANKALSERRAATIVTMLERDYGVASDRVVGLGVGPVAPIASNDTEAGRAENRRVELVVIE
jgi:outer membrane protein OmpA-like peptidoglycan-associated protein